MTICIATPNFPPQAGGIATYYGHLTSLLLKEGHRVIVLMPDESAMANEQDIISSKDSFTKVLLRKQFAPLRKKYQSYFSDGDLDAPAWIASGLAMKEWLIKEHRNFGIDIIEASDFGGFAAFLINVSLPPVVITAHGSYTQLSRYNYSKTNYHSIAIRKLEDISFCKADGILASSPLNKKDLENSYNRTVEFSTVPFQQPLLTGPEKNFEQPRIVGGLQKIKGSVTVAEAIRLFPSRDRKIQVQWIGGDSYSAPGTNKMSEFLRQSYPDIWNKTFAWLKEKTNQDTRQLIINASLIIIPSEWETFSYVALEAASLSKAIIITEKTGASYLFTHGKDAWIIPADDPASLASAILHLTNNPELCERLGNNAAEMIKKTFNDQLIVQERIAIYKQIIAKPKLLIDTHEEQLGLLLKEIENPKRKLYYQLRRTLKKILKPG